MAIPINQLLLATNNRGKLKEMQALLAAVSFNLLTPIELGLELKVNETGNTYAENALLKARAYAAAAGLPTLADDSGLEVDCLQGKPGVHSARFHPLPTATDADRRAYLLQVLQNHPQPWQAKFVCALCLALPNGETYITQDECQGIIIPQERGEHGFGYDPIFYIPQVNKTMAELEMIEKNRLSHRARAVQSAIKLWFS